MNSEVLTSSPASPLVRSAGWRDSHRGLPRPAAPTAPVWLWSAVLAVLSLGAAAGWLIDRADPLRWALLPFTFVGNSLAMVPYDWFIPAYVQGHTVVSAIVLATSGTVLVEFWNMDVLARVLARDSTAGLRRHEATARLLRWYGRAPWLTLVVAGMTPVLPFYPCRILASLSRYPLWRYQSAVIAGRSGRYAWLAGVGIALPVPPAGYAIAGIAMFAALLFASVRGDQRRES